MDFVRKSRMKSVVVVLAVVIVLVGFFVSALLMPLTPKAPPDWARVHTGMAREDILRVVGVAKNSGYPEKILERWSVAGLFATRWLAVVYDNQGRAKVVTEYIYWRGTGRTKTIRNEQFPAEK